MTTANTLPTDGPDSPNVVDTPVEAIAVPMESIEIKAVPAPTVKETPVVKDVPKPEPQRFEVTPASLAEVRKIFDDNAELFETADANNEPNLFAIKLIRLMRSGNYTADAELHNEMLTKASPENILVAASKISTSSSFGKDLRGDQATLAFTSRLKGLKKVYLYNSGFYVILRPWSMGELNMFFQSIDAEDSEIGRLLGYCRFTIHDAFIKQRFMEILPSCIVGCNLKGWKNGKTLAKNLSFHDYDVLLWAVSSLMQKEPINLSLTCLEENCKHEEVGSYDINKMYLLNNKVISPAAFEFVHAEKDVSPEELVVYRKDLISSSTTIIYNNIRFTLSVPSMDDYLEVATKAVTTLIASSQDINDLKNRILMNNTIIDFNRNYVPWISDIAMLKENGTTDFNTKDRTSFTGILETLGIDDASSEFHTKMSDFIRDTSGAVIGYIPPSCSKCNRKYNTTSGYVAWDIERLFFDLTYLALNEIGLLLN